MGPSLGPLLQGGIASILRYTLVGGGHIPLGKVEHEKRKLQHEARCEARHTPVLGRLVGEHNRIKAPEPELWVTGRSESSGSWERFLAHE